MNKKELLDNALYVGNEDGYISWDGVLDLCDEDPKLVSWLADKLEKMDEEGKIDFELDF